MTEQEAIDLSQYVAALCPGQRFNEFTPDAWTEVLAPYDAGDARRAVVQLARRTPFIAPAEIIREIQAMRNARIEAANLVYDGDPDETPEESVARRRALIRAAGDGQLQPAQIGRVRALEAAPRPKRTAAMLEAVADSNRPPREGAVNVLSIACPRCAARPGRTCTTNGRRRADVHPARLDAARRRAAGLPPADPAAERAELERRRAASAAALAGGQPADAEPRDGYQHPDPGSEAS